MNDRRLLGVIEKIYEAATDPVYSRLGFAERELEMTREILAGLAVGVIITTADQKVLYVNQTAERVLRDGRGITVREGRLVARDAQTAAQLQRHISEAVRTSAGDCLQAGAAMRIDLPTGSVLSVLVAPFQARDPGCGPELPAAMVIFRDPDAADENWENALARVYRLTPAEARLLAAILSGSTLSDYTDVAGISINTAKTHLRNIFRKTGHSRQGDLIREVASDPVVAMLRKNGSRFS